LNYETLVVRASCPLYMYLITHMYLITPESAVRFFKSAEDNG